MNDSFTFEVADERGTLALGESLAAVLPRNCVIALIGPLGAGKTRLVQAVAQAAGVEEGIVASPTFVLVHEYAGRVPIFHFDAYRLRGADEFLGTGTGGIFRARRMELCGMGRSRDRRAAGGSTGNRHRTDRRTQPGDSPSAHSASDTKTQWPTLQSQLQLARSLALSDRLRRRRPATSRRLFSSFDFDIDARRFHFDISLLGLHIDARSMRFDAGTIFHGRTILDRGRFGGGGGGVRISLIVATS